MGALDKLIQITISTMLAKRFRDWDAFKFGLIDEKGNKLREPKTKEERKSLDTIKNLVRKIKRTLVKFTPDTPTVQFVLAHQLLKEHANEIKNLTNTEKLYLGLYLNEISENETNNKKGNLKTK